MAGFGLCYTCSRTRRNNRFILLNVAFNLATACSVRLHACVGLTVAYTSTLRILPTNRSHIYYAGNIISVSDDLYTSDSDRLYCYIIASRSYTILFVETRYVDCLLLAHSDNHLSSGDAWGVIT